MIRFIYTVLLCLAAPFLLYGLYKKKPNKPNIGARWKEHFGFTPKLQDQSSSPIWIHTVSVGETIAATPFIKALKLKYPTTPIVITTTTSTGAEQAQKLSGIAEHRYMPLDLPFAIKSFLKAIKPKQMLIMETELWPNIVHYVSSADIPISVINARLSGRSAKRYAKIQPIFNLLSYGLTQILCQHQDDANRFLSLGIAKDKLHVTGSLKFDIDIPDSVIKSGNELRKKLNSATSTRPIWIAASTHKGEDEIVLQAHQQLLETQPSILLILVPRHPERFDDVYLMCKASGFNTIKRTQTSIADSTTQVYLADTMGEMLILMQAADICFMGGSLLGKKVGGHNPLEPAALGLPCLTGRSYFNFTDIMSQLVNAKAAFICHNSENLVQKMHLLFSDPVIYAQSSRAALDVISKNKGSIKRTLGRIHE